MTTTNQPPPPVEQKPEAIARCNFCDWRCVYRGYEADEAALFLTKQLGDHVAAMHPEHAAKNQQIAVKVGDIAGKEILS